MNEQVREYIKQFIQRYRNDALTLDSWVKLKNKNFNTMQALEAIYNTANGKPTEMLNIMKMLSKKDPKYGRRGHVYGDVVNPSLDIVLNNGKVEVIGYKGVVSEPETNNISPRNSNIFRKSDGQTKIPYKKTSDEIHNIGKFVRTNYKTYSDDDIIGRVNAIMNYSSEKKISYEKVINNLLNKKLTIIGYGGGYKIVPNNNNFHESKRIIVGESALKIFESMEREMTYYSFLSNVKSFLSDLLNNPSTAKPSIELLSKGFNRSKLLSCLINKGIINKDEKIIDEDENGNPQTAKMNIKFKVPKKDFERNMKKLYIKLFEKNIPQEGNIIVNDFNIDAMKDNTMDVSEDGEGATNCSSSGQFSQPMFGVQKREIYNTKPNEELEETTTTMNSGDYQYTVPFPGDKSTLSRKNGKDSSISINRIK